MNKNIKIKVTKEDYFKVLRIVDTYANNAVYIHTDDTYILIKFTCSIFKINRCKHDLKLAIELGIDMKIEIES